MFGVSCELWECRDTTEAGPGSPLYLEPGAGADWEVEREEPSGR